MSLRLGCALCPQMIISTNIHVATSCLEILSHLTCSVHCSSQRMWTFQLFQLSEQSARNLHLPLTFHWSIQEQLVFSRCFAVYLLQRAPDRWTKKPSSYPELGQWQQNCDRSLRLPLLLLSKDCGYFQQGFFLLFSRDKRKWTQGYRELIKQREKPQTRSHELTQNPQKPILHINFTMHLKLMCFQACIHFK